MKKLFLILLFFLLATTPVVANEIPLIVTSMPTPAVQQEINYALPYPGLLPDSPLYIFKAMRDKLVSILIKDPKKQAEFDLLQADKRVNAAMYLLQGSRMQEKLALETISKGDNYFFFAVANTAVAKKRGEDVNGFLDLMLASTQRHEQVMRSLEQHSSPLFKIGMDQEIQRVKNIAKEITQLK